jgi:hypothetical protein
LSLSFLSMLYWLGRKGSPFPDFPLTRLAWFLATFAVLALAARPMRRAAPYRFAPLQTWPLSPLTAGLLVILLANGLGPYLGFKSALSFSMYSNLRVEGSSNHFLIPKGSIQLFDGIDDLVTLLDSSSPQFARLARQGSSLPLLELRRRLSLERRLGHDDVTVGLLYRGKAVTVRVGTGDPFFMAEPGFVASKLFTFREVPPAGVNRCLW